MSGQGRLVQADSRGQNRGATVRAGQTHSGSVNFDLLATDLDVSNP